MKPIAEYAGIISLLVAGCIPSRSGGVPGAEAAGPGPMYTAQGELQRPRGYQDWVLAGVSLGLEYSEEKQPEGPGKFHSVYLPAEAYRQYARTGKFPEKTMLVLEVCEPGEREVIVKQGWFPGKLTAVAAAVKDRERFPEGWAYFDFGRDREKAKALAKDRCFNCHAAHGADDNVFVQFYPTLRELKRPGEKDSSGSR